MHDIRRHGLLHVHVHAHRMLTIQFVTGLESPEMVTEWMVCVCVCVTGIIYIVYYLCNGWMIIERQDTNQSMILGKSNGHSLFFVFHLIIDVWATTLCIHLFSIGTLNLYTNWILFALDHIVISILAHDRLCPTESTNRAASGFHNKDYEKPGIRCEQRQQNNESKYKLSIYCVSQWSFSSRCCRTVSERREKKKTHLLQHTKNIAGKTKVT